MAVSHSSRSPLMAALRAHFRKAAAPPQSADHPWPDAFPGRVARDAVGQLDRRDFLKGALVLGAGSLIPGCGKGDSGRPETRSKPAGAAPRVVIVGAGIAGLSAAHHLAKAGIAAEIHEAGHRAGGRILTLRDIAAPGLFTEAGGEFIDSTHADMLALAKELGLGLADMRSNAYDTYHPTAWRFADRHRSDAQVLAEVKAAAERMRPDIESLPEDIGAGTVGPAADLDRMSIAEYLEKRGITGWFGDLLKAAYVTEFGLDADEQSSLNLLTMVSLDTSGKEFAVYGESDERFRLEGGNQALTDALARRLEDRLRLGHRLEALSGRDGGFRLTFQGPSGVVERKADVVILALPFTLLRSVDLRLDLPEAKRRAVAELGMGTNSKLFLGYRERPWRKNGYLGYFFSDGPMQSGWDHTQTQAGEAGGLTVFQGGSAGMALGQGSPASHAAAFAPALEDLFPGSLAAANGNLGAFHWPAFPLSLGSYSCYRPGQWTTFGGEEGTPVDDLHFAGEQCSGEFQGYMNGGAESGRRAAEAVVAKWKAGRGK